MHIRKLWIQDGSPCILATSGEVVALCLALGIKMQMTDDDQSRTSLPVSSRGAFGISIFAEPIAGCHRWKLVISHDQRNPDQDFSKGSGYLVSHAIRMACKCLPFAASDGYTHAVPMLSRFGTKAQGRLQHQGHQHFARRLSQVIPQKSAAWNSDLHLSRRVQGSQRRGCDGGNIQQKPDNRRTLA